MTVAKFNYFFKIVKDIVQCVLSGVLHWTYKNTSIILGGYYIYIEASNNQANATARVVSPRIQSGAGPKCLQFWYHMYGAHINTLNVYVQDGANLGSPKWTRKGTQGNRWKLGSLVINATTGYNVSYRRYSDNMNDGSMFFFNHLWVRQCET